MKSHVSTYGGELRGAYPTVKHWQLHVDGVFIGDTSIPKNGELFERVAEALNRDREKAVKK